MAVSAKAIKSKIASVQNVGKITKAMELVSVSKMKKAVGRVETTRPYATEALSVLTNISANVKRDHTLLSHGDNDKNLVILISSNRGLCGSYNARVAKAASDYTRRAETKHGSTCEFVCVGRYAEAAARRLRRPIKASFQDFGEAPSLGDVSALAEAVHQLFETGDYWNVVMIFTNFVSALTSEVYARQLLPVSPKNILNLMNEGGSTQPVEIKQSVAELQFEPGEAAVLDVVLRRLTDAQLFHALSEAAASEHSSRMVAMKNATENANRLSDELTLTYNRARQAAITQEISEIASGADALSG